MVCLSALIAASLAAAVSVSGHPLSARQNKSFSLKNGQDAQQQNADFSKLTANSPCDSGENACIDGKFAQCVGGKFVIVGCSAGTQCFALPLVNKQGTTITCATQKDAEERISDTGATGGITGDGNDSPNKSTPAPAPTPAPTSEPAPSQSPSIPPAAPPADAKSFTLKNGQDAQGLNKHFSTLNANSSCQNDEKACVGGGFAQCVDGKFEISQCSSGTKCFALPLVKKAGTSIACDTEDDAAARIANTGATGGIQG